MSGSSSCPLVRQLSYDQVLIKVGGRRIVAQAACPHRKGRLRYGYVNERTLRITCPLHYSTFDLTTGEPVSGPSCDPLQVNVLPSGAPDPVAALEGSGDDEKPSG